MLKITGEQYSCVLYELVRMACQDFENMCKEIEMKEDLFNYLTYYEYKLYLTEKILQTKYSIEDSHKFIDGVWKWLEKQINNSEAINSLQELYNKLLRDENLDIYDERTMHKLVNNFMDDVELGKCFIAHNNIFLSFSGFIMYHTEDVLNKNIEIIK